MENIKFKYLPNYTYKDYDMWEGKWELIDGIPYAMTPSPVYKHQLISHNIAIQLDELLKNCKNCQALFGLDWRIKDDKENTVLCPDNFVMCKEIVTDFLTEPPDIIFEILSPATAERDKFVKYKIYEQQGVQYYVIVNPENNAAEVYELKINTYKKTLDAANDKFKFNLKNCTFEFDFNKLWNK